jgi:hypothetical protein
MTVRTAVLAVGVSGNGVFATVYTCPPGRTAILKDIRLTATGASTTRAIVACNSGPHGTYLIDQPLPANHGVQGAFIVLEPGDTVSALHVGGPFNVRLHGSELDGVAP